jgi:thiamine biosynthesis lipoprotein
MNRVRKNQDKEGHLMSLEERVRDSNLPRAVLALDLQALVLHCHGSPDAFPVCLDLGAIGKGFALDVMARDLREWDMHRALLIAGGGSSVLALDPPYESTGAADSEGWCISMSSRQLLMLENAAISASGTRVKGAHILDPATGRPPVAAPVRTWAMAPTAAWSDALSTAWMILDINEIALVCAQTEGVTAALELEGPPGNSDPLLFIDATGPQHFAPQDWTLREVM